MDGISVLGAGLHIVAGPLHLLDPAVPTWQLKQIDRVYSFVPLHTYNMGEIPTFSGDGSISY